MTVTMDTNVLIYTVDERDRVKQEVARDVFRILAAKAAPIALQVIGEFQNALVKRLRRPPAIAAAAAHQLLATFKTFAYDLAAVQHATSSFATGRFSYWDGLLLISAERAGLRVLLSEDMQDGVRLGAIEVINPFSSVGLSPRARASLAL